MKRTLTLYIGNMPADLSDESFVLLNLRQDDLGNPTVVRNSFTQQITLLGTERNNAIFGHFYRVDRAVDPASGSIGPGFDPSRKTPFRIYNEHSEILMAGYVKLDNVVRVRNRVEYKVTLYGGLGSFLFSLYYHEDGTPKSLASLDYLGTDNPDGELDFIINATTVKGAWNNAPVVLTRTSHTTSARLRNSDGGIASGSSTYYVDEFNIAGLSKIYISGWTVGANTYTGAAILDAGGTLLATYYHTSGGGQNFSGYEVTVPSGGAILRIQSRTGSSYTQADARYLDDRWKVLSFAPAYNGIPENFSADKGIFDPIDPGLPTTQGDYTVDSSDLSLLNFAEPHDEWEMKDLRSYLQRPVLSMRAFFDSISRPENNGGYTVDYSDISGSDYLDTWLTLPMLPSLSPSNEAGVVSLGAMSSGRKDIVGAVPSGAEVTASFGYLLKLRVVGSSATYLYSGATNSDTKPKGHQTAFFIQIVAYDSGDNAVGGSTIRSWYDFDLPAEEMAAECGFLPEWPAAFEPAEIGIVTFVGSSGIYSKLQGAGDITALNVAYYKVVLTAFAVDTVTENGVTYLDNVSQISNPKLYADYSTSYNGIRDWADQGTASISVKATSFIRSNALITKAMLLSTSRTPADYLLSFCKTFGLYMVVDEPEKAVTILGRNSLYLDIDEDITPRVHLEKGLDITPLAFDAKWYDFDPEVVEGAFAKEYADIYGIPYGIQRVNTGYDFNADARNLLDGTVLKAAAAILRHSKYYNIIKDNGTYLPSPWIDKGNTYTLWNSDGESAEFPVPGPKASATVDYLNPSYPGYDVQGASKPEFAAIDNKAVDGVDVLLFRDGTANYPYFALTDDLPEMDTLNGGPCWLPFAGGSLGIDIPVFSRYKMSGDDVVLSLDFGKPKEIALPGVSYPENVTVYRHCWADYLADKYNRDTKVLKCRVNLTDKQVTRALLRQFYYFGGSVWVLNAIINHSMTTFDPTECEFVQVQDKDAYLSGQNL